MYTNAFLLTHDTNGINYTIEVDYIDNRESDYSHNST